MTIRATVAVRAEVQERRKVVLRGPRERPAVALEQPAELGARVPERPQGRETAAR